MKVLFLGCHCDDLELGCGGTIHKYSKEWDITCITLSTQGLCNGQLIEVKNSSEKSLRFLGVKDIRYFNFQVNSFYLKRQSIWENLKNFDSELSPNLVFTIESDNQQDHKTLYEEVLRNFRKSSIISYKSSLRNSPHHVFNYYEKLSKKNLIAKKKCLSFYPNEYKKYIYFNEKNIESTLRYGGVYIEEEFAECFNIVKLIK